MKAWLKVWGLWILVAIVALSLVVTGLLTEDDLNDFPKTLLAEIVGILASFFIGWLFFERRASTWLEKVKYLLEKMEKQQQEGRFNWTKDIGHPTALLLVEVTHQLVNDLQRIDENLPAPWEQSVSMHANEIFKKIGNFFNTIGEVQLDICRAAAMTLTQSNKLLERLQILLQTGPDWFKQDIDVTRSLEEALRFTEQFHPALLMVGNIHPDSRRVSILPGDFNTIEGKIWSVSLRLYMEELLKLAKALDNQARREGFDWPVENSGNTP